MAKKAEQPKMRTAVLKKRKQYKFGKVLDKGTEVFIKEEYVGHSRFVYTAFRKENDTLGFGVTRSEFEYTEKEEFVVFVTRTSYAHKNIKVKATDREEAKRLALEQAGDFVFSESDADYTADIPLSVDEHKKVFPNSDVHK